MTRASSARDSVCSRHASIARRSCQIAATLLLVMALRVAGASAQITAATVSGVVADETGGVLPGVDVTLKNVETGFTRSVGTADDGSYNLPGLPPGMYDVRASRPGFTPAVRSGIQLAVGQQASLNLTLKVGVTEMVIVAGRPAGARRHEKLLALGPRRCEDDRRAAPERSQLHRARAAPAAVSAREHEHDRARCPGAAARR